MPYRRSRSKVAGLATAAFLWSRANAAGFDGSSNVVMYWGQNSYNQASGDLAQQSLSTYCANTDIDIIPMAFMVQITTGQGGEPTINFANQGNNCTVFPDTGLLDCPQIGDDIKTCQQKYGKTILLSIGGATYTEGGFASKDAAVAAANLVWNTFGPASGASNSSSSITPSATNSTTSLIGSAHSTSTINSTAPGRNAPATQSSRNATTTLAPVLPSAVNSTSLEKGNTVNSTATLTKQATSASEIEILSLVTTLVTMLEEVDTEAGTASTVQATTRSSVSTQAGTANTNQVTTRSSVSQAQHDHKKTISIHTTTSAHSTSVHRKTVKITHTTTTRAAKAKAVTTSSASSTPTAETVSYETTHGHARRQAKTVRPFHEAVIDGFDLDLETSVQNFNAFAGQLRTLMDGDKSKKYFLTAAPQCPYPDAADDSMLNGGPGLTKIKFDAIFVQFYNNYCGTQAFVANSTTQNNFNFETWDNWATTKSANKDVKVFLGVPAGKTAAGSGYVDVSGLKPIIEYCKTFASFGGVMAWDASQAYANTGFLDGVKGVLQASTKRARAVRRMVGREWWG